MRCQSQAEEALRKSMSGAPSSSLSRFRLRERASGAAIASFYNRRDARVRVLKCLRHKGSGHPHPPANLPASSPACLSRLAPSVGVGRGRGGSDCVAHLLGSSQKPVPGLEQTPHRQSVRTLAAPARLSWRQTS
jgi:hypothetical protein